MPVWYPITSRAGHGPPPRLHRVSASAMKPSIFPRLMSRALAGLVCGPPWLLSACNTYGLTQSPAIGSGTHTVGTPWFIGMPIAPG